MADVRESRTDVDAGFVFGGCWGLDPSVLFFMNLLACCIWPLDGVIPWYPRRQYLGTSQ